MGTRGSIGEVSYRGASWGAITLTKQVAKNNCQRTSIGCRLIRWHICPDPSSAGWERVKKSWGAVAQTPIRAAKETSANPSKLGLQRFAGRNKQQNKLVVNSERFLLDGEFNSPPSPPIHTILPSGIAVIGIDSWVERFTKIFQNLQPDQEGYSSPLINFKPHSQPPNVISSQHSGGDLWSFTSTRLF